MNPFPPLSTGAQIYEQAKPRLHELVLVRQKPTQPSLIQQIHSISLTKLFGVAITNQPMAHAVKAGLYVLLDAWDEGHAIAQDLNTIEGSYWHGIIHRREPDAGNAKYWFRRVGQHPIFKQLGSEETRQGLLATTAFDHLVRSGLWEPCSFIDLCIECETGQSPELKSELRVLQMNEIQLLLTYCIQNATAK